MLHTTIQHRTDIDGLRAVAVLSVIAFHAFPTLVPGGFVGVDVFFVISGFLITSILACSFETSTFSFAKFYGRRVKRIFPSLIIVIICSLIVGWYILLGDEYKQLGKHIAGGASFISNFILWNESSYFDNSAETKPLLHLWSLGVEEQFYIIWPVIIWMGYKLKTNLFLISIVILIASFFLNITTIHSDAVAAFYSPLTRFWELSIGSALALFIMRFADSVTRWQLSEIRINSHLIGLKLSNISSILGLVLILFSIMGISKNALFPGWWACIPTIGAALIISSGSNSWANRYLLANKYIVWIGLISYPLYLWHWPLISFAHILTGEMPSRIARVILVAISFILAWLTFRYIEKPIRYGNHSPRWTVKILSLSMIVVFSLGFLVYVNDGLTSRKIAMATSEITKAKSDWVYKSTKLKSGEIVDLNILNGRSEERVLYIGDSLMGQYYARALKIYSNESHIPFYTSVFASRNHCRPIPFTSTISAPEHISCDDYYSAAIKLAQKNIYKKIVFSGNWESVFRDYPLDMNIKKLMSDIANLKKQGKEVVFISMAPHSSIFDPVNLAKYYRLPTTSFVAKDRWVSREALEKLDANWYGPLSRIAKLTQSKLINPYDYFCREDSCPLLIAGKPLYNDGYHIRATAAGTYATFIDEIVAQ